MIRPLGAHDREPVLELLRSTNNFSPAEIDVADELIGIVVEKRDQQDYHAFVAEEDVRGVTGFLLLGPTPATVGTWDLYWMAAHPSVYGAGVAQALDAFAKSFARARGAYLLIAETSGRPSYARARAFYTKQGYEELARIADYYAPADDLVVFGSRLLPG